LQIGQPTKEFFVINRAGAAEISIFFGEAQSGILLYNLERA